MTITTKPGKLTKQGPIVTLQGSPSLSSGDKFLFNGSQFVQFISQPPKVIEASANSVVTVGFNGEVERKNSYLEFKDVNGTFRFVNGNPTTIGIFTGWPSDYDHVIIGYEREVSTSSIKFWAEEYIPTELLRVDYGWDGNDWYNVPTHAGNVSFIFDDTIKRTEDEASPSGMYVYTISFGQTYSAKYWRIRSFLTTYSMSKTTISGTMTVPTTSGLPSTAMYYSLGTFKYSISNTGTSSDMTTNWTRYTSATYHSERTFFEGMYYISGLVLNPASYQFGTIERAGLQFYIREQYYDGGLEPKYSTLGHGYNAEQIVFSSVPDSVSFYASGWDIPATLPFLGGGPHGGRVYVDCEFTVSGPRYVDSYYTSKTSTSLSTLTTPGYTPSTIPPCSNFFYSYPMKLTQVSILENSTPLLRFWEADGEEAHTKQVSVGDIYDLVYDDGDECFYAAVFNSEGGRGPDPSDSFSSSSFDGNRWVNNGGAFVPDITVSGVIFVNTTSGTDVYGKLTTNSYFSGDFSSSVLFDVNTLSGTGYFGIYSQDKESGSFASGSFVSGDWGTAGTRRVYGVGVGGYVNASDNNIEMRDLNINPVVVPEGKYKHTILLDDSAWYYTRTAELGSSSLYNVSSECLGPSGFISFSGISLVLDNNGNIEDGQYVSFTTNKNVVSSIPTISGVSLYVDYNNGTNIFSNYYSTGSKTLINNTSCDFWSSFRHTLYGATDNFVNILASGVSFSGSYMYSIPSIKVLALDMNGDVISVAGVTNSEGEVLSDFAVINTYGTEYGDYYSLVNIATDGLSEASFGSMFVRVGEDLYKYDKTTLPVDSMESGETAVLLASGVVPNEKLYNFAYDGYANGGLSYVAEDTTCDGIFVKELFSATLMPTGYRAELDISSISNPLFYDASDITTLYTLVDDDVYVYNMDPTSVAFCNVISSEPVVPANSGYQSTITAHVVNLFGDPLQSKLVTFAITTGGGSLSTATDCTSSSGTATTQFTADAVAGTSIITATASNTSC